MERNGQIMANNPYSIRGRTIIALVGDEAALWETGADGANDEELLSAVLPSMLTVRDGGLAHRFLVSGYTCFADTATGTGKDSIGFAIAHDRGG